MPRLDVGRFINDTDYSARIRRSVENGMIGSFCIFNAELTAAKTVLAELQLIANKHSLPPLLFSCDCEWGLAMRFSGEVIEFPHALALANSKYLNAVYSAASAIAGQMRELGLHWNFAPVADVNSNPDNPIINIRSFGEDPLKVGENAKQYFFGLRDNGIIATAKHFPGHGNTKVDSHSALPILTEPASTFESVELPPFVSLIEAAIPSIMTGHLSAPLLAKSVGANEEESMLPATVSPFLLQILLRKKLGYTGVIISDSLEMAAINTLFGNESILCEKAMRAGCDIVLMPIAFEAVYDSLVSLCRTDDTFFELIKRSSSRIERMIAQNTNPALQFKNKNNDEMLSYEIARSAISIPENIEPLKNVLTYCIIVDDEVKQASKIDLLHSKMSTLLPDLRYIEKIINDALPHLVFILQRPRGKLLDESSVTTVSPVDKFLEALTMEKNQPDCIILLGNPYLENKLPHCKAIIKTYSDSIPSINGIVDYLAATR